MNAPAAFSPRTTALVLTAGGARGAYQAGVLKRIGELRTLKDGPAPFPIITGASAGAINGAAIAAYHTRFGEGTALLSRLWSQLTVTDVFRTDFRALAGNGVKLVLDMALGGLIGAGRVEALVDAAPLRAFLERHLPMGGIPSAIDAGHLHAIAVTACGYHSGKAFTFVQGREGLPLWNKSRRVALPAKLSIDHILASSAIPIIFPPVPLTTTAGARAYFGDGALRLVTPLSPAIRLGAGRLFAIGVRCKDSADDLQRSELTSVEGEPSRMRRPPLSQICGVFMNAIFLDHLDADLDHLVRMNEIVASHVPAPVKRGDTRPRPEAMRIVKPLLIAPSDDIAILAKTLAHRMPRGMRYILDGLGTPDAQSADLMSYLLFDAAFTRELIQLGYRDADRRIDEIEEFLCATDSHVARAPAREKMSGHK